MSADEVVVASHSAHVAAPAALVWRYFDWPNAHLILPGGLFTAVDYLAATDGRGAGRKLQLASGDVVTEYLLENDPVRMRLRYAVADPTPMPVRAYTGEVQVTATDAAHCDVHFRCRCQLRGISAADWQRQYAALQQSILGIIQQQLQGAA